MHLAIRQAAVGDIPVISDILHEAAHWLQREGAPMWRDDEVTPERIASDVAVGSFYLAEIAGEAIGTLKFQLSDSVFWPDVPTDESAFIHRVAVRRRFSGGTVSSALLAWAAERAHALGRRFLRLDCEASRLRLRAVYERFGFLHHSDRQVGPYFVSRYELPLPRLRPHQTMERTADRHGSSMKEAVTDAQQRPGFQLKIKKKATRALAAPASLPRSGGGQVRRRSSC